ncbi:unnamed protein product [Camellia sinensis]
MEENGTKDPRTLTTFHRRERIFTHHHNQKSKCEMGNAGGGGAAYESLASGRRVRGRRTTTTTTTTRKKRRDDVKILKESRSNSSNTSGGGDDDEEEEEDEKAEVERKIMALQRIVPGADSLVGIDTLFDQTASYILALQSQLNSMRLLATFFEALDNGQRKLGG